jgi:hypothetical protein
MLRTPGYPVFLIPFLAHIRAAVLTQAVIGTFVCALVAWFIGKRHGTFAGTIAAAFVAIDVPTILESKEIMTELFSRPLQQSSYSHPWKDGALSPVSLWAFRRLCARLL